MEKENNIQIFCSKIKSDHELLDTGDGKRLERFGQYSFIRPCEDAIWKKTLNIEWQKADGEFITAKERNKAGWKMNTTLEKRWAMVHGDVRFYASPTSFRHLSFFPEQAHHWEYIHEKIKNAGRPIKFLNLFGYTGVASLFALSAGAEVTHVDASKESVSLFKENQKLSGLEEKPARVIIEDCLKFIEREAKRGNTYDAIIMDPPKFGRGPKGEIWKIEESLPKLLSAVKNILSDKPLFVIVTSYTTDSSSLNLGYALREMMHGFDGSTQQGELCVLEKSKERMLSMAHTAIWSSH